ncbi:hypothetical protein HDU76_008672, partial [Blyttiomyces sp. JEL0837]
PEAATTFLKKPPSKTNTTTNNIKHVILRALIMRNVDGLDEALFEKALRLRREFEAERASLNF